MNTLVIALFLAVLFLEFALDSLTMLPGYLIMVPELLSGIAALLVIGRAIGGKRLNLSSRYVFVLAVLAVTVLIGIVVQSVAPGPIISGLRDYLRLIPFFLLPAVYHFSDRQLKLQFAILLPLLALQVPLAIYQRFGQFASKMHTGDIITGTVSNSGALSLLMLGCIAAVIVLYLRRKLSLTMTLLLVAFFFAPTTINETKATLILLPVCIFAPLVFMPRGQRPMRKLLPIMGMAIVAGGAFVAVYDYMIQFREYGKPISSFLFQEDRAQNYLYKGTLSGGDGVSRLDSLEIAAVKLSEEPLALVFGLGVGNTTVGPFQGFDGAYAGYYRPYGVGETQITTFMWEVGVLGLACFLLLYFFIYRDARYLARNNGLLGQVWSSVMIIMTLSLLYQSYFTMNEISYFVWFYSGVVASRARALRQSQAYPAVVPATVQPAGPALGSLTPATAVRAPEVGA